MRFAVAAVRFPKNRDEHRRNVLQEIFGFSVLEKFGVLLQLVRDLVDNKSATGRERVVRLLKKSALLVDLQNAEWNSGNDVVAGFDPAAMKFSLQVRGVVVDHMNSWIVHELAA